jgi:hypothetical protein
MKNWENTILLADPERLTEWINRLLSYSGHNHVCTVGVTGSCSCGAQALWDEIYEAREACRSITSSGRMDEKQ